MPWAAALELTAEAKELCRAQKLQSSMLKAACDSLLKLRHIDIAFKKQNQSAKTLQRQSNIVNDLTYCR